MLLGGLLPEFKAEKTLILKQPISTFSYEDVGNDLTDFAITEEIYNLKSGGTKGAPKSYNVNVNGADVGASANSRAHPSRSCHNWANTGKCIYGDDCKSSHQRGRGARAN